MALVLIGQLDWNTLQLEFPRGKTVRLEPGEKIEMGRGSLEFQGADDLGYLVIRRSGSGRVTYAKTIDDASAWSFGPHYSHRVVDPADENDPILKVMRTFKVPVGRLRLITSGITAIDGNDHSSRDGFENSGTRVFGDFTDKRMVDGKTDPEGCCSYVELCSGATVLVQAFAMCDMNETDIYSADSTDYIWNADILRVYAAPEADPQDLEKYLKEAMRWANELTSREAFPEYLLRDGATG